MDMSPATALLIVVVGLLAIACLTELGDWCPALARAVVRLAARRLRDPVLSCRYEEEWLGNIEYVSCKLFALTAAFGIFYHAPRLRVPARQSSGPSDASSKLDLDAIALSEREFDVVSLYASGLSRKFVAVQLGIRPETVKAHLSRARKKFKEAGFPASTKVDLLRCLLESGYQLRDLPMPRPDADAPPSSRTVVGWHTGKPR
jgi:DNA-binding CsgD family transcriptional regulator